MLSELKKLSKHAVIYGVGNTATKAVSFLLLPIYTRYLSTEDYGILAILTTFSLVMGIILEMGLRFALFRYYFLYEDTERRRKLACTVFLFLLLSSATVLGLLLVLVQPLCLLLLQDVKFVAYVRITIFTVFLDTGSVIPFALLRAREQSIEYASLSFARFVVNASLAISFVVAMGKGLAGVFHANLATSLLFFFILLSLTFREIKWAFSIVEIKTLLKYGFPVVFGSLGNWSLNLSDRFFLQRSHALHDVGIYSVGYSISSVVSLLTSSFSVAWGPFMFSISKKENAKSVYARVLTYFVLVSGFISLIISLFAQDMLKVMTTPDFVSAYMVVPLITLSYVFGGMYQIIGLGLALSDQLKYHPLIIAVAALINLLLNYLLISPYGMMGAAISTAASYFIMPTVQVFIAQKYYPVDYEFSRIFKIGLACLLTYLAGIHIRGESIFINFVVNCTLSLLWLGLLYLLGFFYQSELSRAKQVGQKVFRQLFVASH